MPSWSEVLNEINLTQSKGGSIDVIRRKYLQKLYNYTGRNIITYYSGWLQCGNVAGIDINDMDINGFMSAICGLDCSKGLDLILHTPGGTISAAEQIVYYLKSKFGNNIRAFVPQISMSAGSMIACSCKKIVMGKQSCLGPFEPQLNGVSAGRVLAEFEQAAEEIKEIPEKIYLWQVIIGKYHPTFLASCQFAIEKSKDLVNHWLVDNMFAGESNAEDIAEKIVKKFTDIGHVEGHDRHIPIQDCIDFGLKIEKLEDDQRLQDLVLTVHHAYMHTFSLNNFAVKAIENHKGTAMFNFGPKPT